jgi:hypothetical protein
MSYSVIYERFRIILDNSKFKEILHRKSLYEYGPIFWEPKYAKFVLQKDVGALQRKCFLGKSVNWKKIKDQLK